MPDKDETDAPPGYIWVLFTCDRTSYEYAEYFCAVGMSIPALKAYFDENWTGSELVVTKTEEGHYSYCLTGSPNQPNFSQEEFRAELHKIL